MECIKSYPDLQMFYYQKQFVDLTIYVGKEIFKCHQVIMSSVSQYIFRNLEFSKKSEIILEDKDPKIIKIILDTIYGIKHTISDFRDQINFITYLDYLQIDFTKDIFNVVIPTTLDQVHELLSLMEELKIKRYEIEETDLFRFKDLLKEEEDYKYMFNRKLICGSRGGDIYIYHIMDILGDKNLSPISILKGHSNIIVTLDVYENMLVSGSWDQDIRIWDLSTYQCLYKIYEKTRIAKIKIIPNTQHIIVGLSNGQVNIRDFQGNLIKSLTDFCSEHYEYLIISILLIKDYIVIGSLEGIIKSYNYDYVCIDTLNVDHTELYVLEEIKDRLITNDKEYRIKISNPEKYIDTQDSWIIVDHHKQNIIAYDDYIEVWDLDGNRLHYTSFKEIIRSIIIYGQFIITNDYANILTVYDPDRKKMIRWFSMNETIHSMIIV